MTVFQHFPPALCRRVALMLSAVALVGGCNADSPALILTPVDAPTLSVRIISGDRQLGVAGDTLAPIVALVTDLAGAPKADVVVTWRVNDRGSITPLAARTDDAGLARALWKLGTEDDHDGTARVEGGAAGSFAAAEPEAMPLDLLEVGLLRPHTYDGSRETVHPDFVRTPADWGAYSQHLALTPYPNGSSQLENPSVFVSRSGYRWFPQAGVINPLVSPGTNGYLSDPDMVYHPQLRELWMYYRKVDTRNRIMMVRSPNGSDWSAPIAIVDAPNHLLVSPSIVRRDDKTWLMWTVNAGSKGCSDLTSTVQLRRSADGIKWGPAITLSISNGYLTPWHLEVQWIPSLKQYWALYPAKRPGTCATQALYLATSTDGITWTTYPSPVLEAGALSQLKDIVYRSTFEYDDATDEVRFWFSGANIVGTAYDWRTVMQRRKRDELIASIASPRSPVFIPNANRTMPVMLNPP